MCLYDYTIVQIGKNNNSNGFFFFYWSVLVGVASLTFFLPTAQISQQILSTLIERFRQIVEPMTQPTQRLNRIDLLLHFKHMKMKLN